MKGIHAKQRPHSLTSHHLCSGQLPVSISSDILVLVTLELNFVLLSVWGLEVDIDLGALGCVNGAQGTGFGEIEVKVLRPLRSEGLEGLLGVDCQSDILAVNQFLVKRKRGENCWW